MAADATAVFGISVTDDASPGARSARKSLEDLEASIKSDTLAIAQMQKALKTMGGGTVVNVEQFKKLKQSIADTKIRLAESQTKALQMGQSFGKSSDATDQLKQSLLGAGGPLGQMSNGVGGLLGKLGKGGLIGLAILAAAALIALGVAAARAAIGLAKFGLAAADARRDEGLMLEGMTRVPLWLGLWGPVAKQSGTQIQSMIDQVSGSVSQSREEIVGLATSLYAMGLRGKAALKAVADAQAVGGERGKAYAIGLITWNRMLGKSAEQTAKIIEAKFGDLAAKKAAGFGVQMAKLRENFKLLFSGVKIEGFLLALKKVTDLFSQNTVTGRALKQIIEVLFNPIFGGASKAGDLVRDLFRDGVIWVQRTILAFQKLEIWYLKTFKTPWFDIAAATAVKVALWSIVGVLATIAAIVASIGAGMALLAAPFVVIGSSIVGLIVGIKALWKWLSSIDWGSLGRNIVQGIADGVTGAAGLLWRAIKGIGSGALNLLKGLLGIHSPSVVFKNQIGRNIDLGIAQGVRDYSPSVHSALRDVVPANTVGGPATIQNQTKREGNVYHVTIPLQTALDQHEVEDAVYSTLHRLELEVGAA